MAVCLSFSVFAQDLKPVAKKIYDKKQNREEFVPVSLFNFSSSSQQKLKELSNVVSDATILEYQKNIAHTILITHPANIDLIIPSANGNVEVELFQSNIFTPDFSVTTSGTNGRAVTYTGGLHYWGIVKGDNTSLAAISIYDNEVMGLITSPAFGNLVLGKLENNVKGDHIFYNDKKLKTQPNIECSTISDNVRYQPKQLQGAERVMANCIRLFWEVNYDIFQNKGSVTNAANYVTGLFNQSAIIYANDAIPVELSEVYVWNTTSPYTSSTTSGQLGIFQATRNSINGDLANLLGLTGGGGIAAGFSGICNANLDASQAYSMIYATYSNVPTYSWSVMVVTHEQGHLMGSRHTHACVWNGNNTAIDGCGPAAGYGYEGSCSGAPIPSGGGTIMSYCHLNAVGINLSLGFGTQPKNVIINNFNNGACLTGCIGNACMPSANMATSNVSSTAATFNWDAASGATSYNLRYHVVGSGTWLSATSATTSYNASGLTPGSNYEWQVQTVCSGGSSVFTISTNFTTQPLTCLAPTGLSTTNITSTSATLNWATASGATSYTIQYRIVGAASWITTTSTGTSINVFSLTSSSNYEWQIQTTCSGGGISSFSSSVNFSTPAPPCNTPQNNFTTNVTDVTATLNWGSPGGTTGSSYNLRYRIAGTSTWTTTSSTASSLTISALSPLSNYEWQVQTVCGISTSAFSTSVPFTTLCSTPAATITANGPTTFCLGGNVLLNANTGAGLTYQWNLNSTPISGATASSYTASDSGNYTVVVTSGTCSATSVATIVSVNPLPSVSISGTTSFCSGSSTTLNAGGGFSSYSWSNGATTPGINVTTAGTFTVTVTNANGCTGSASATTTVNANPTPSISGNTTFCAGSSTTLDAGAGYSSYLWSTGATSQSINAATAGTFTVTVTNANGCAGSTSATTVVNPLPTVSFTGLAPSYNVSSAAATLTGSPVGGTFNGPGISGNTFTASTAGVGGPYSIVYSYTNANGCSNTITQQTSVTSCAAPAQPGTITTTGGAAKVCPGDSKTYSIATVSGAATYTWTAPTGGTIASGQGTKTVIINYTSGFTASGTLSVTSGNGCGNSVARTLAITRNAPATPGVISGAASAVCAGSTKTYSVTNVSGITYNWTAPANASIASGQGTNSVVVDFTSLFVSGTLSVNANNGCGASTARTLSILSKPATPGKITGVAVKVCANTTGAYSVTNVSGVTYNWTAPANATIASGQGTNAVTVSFSASFTSGTLSVAATNTCGSSALRSVVIYSVPGTPGTVTGQGYGNCNNTNTFSISAVTNATSYTWFTSVAGATVTPSGTSASITFPAFSSGNVLVTANNACGSSPVRSFAVKGVANTPGTITGNKTVASCVNEDYSITALPGATSYVWTVPAGSVIVSGQGTTGVTVDYGTTSGSLTVKGVNACGNGVIKSAAITVTGCARWGHTGNDNVDLATASTIAVYPNPFADKLSLEIPSATDEQIEIKVVDVLGKERFKHFVTTNTVEELNIKLPAGIYMITTVVDGQTKTVRVVKEK